MRHLPGYGNRTCASFFLFAGRKKKRKDRRAFLCSAKGLFADAVAAFWGQVWHKHDTFQLVITVLVN